jgi:hypothetical protein
MENISLAIITTNIQYRFETTYNTITSFMTCINSNIIDEVIVSIDMFDHTKYGDFYTEEIIKKKLEPLINKYNIINIYFNSPSGMVFNQKNAINQCKNSYIIYSEDDICMLRLPKKETISKLLENNIIVYNTSLSYIDETKNNIYDESQLFYINNEMFFKKTKENFSSNIKDYQNGNNLSVCFPCAIMKKHIFYDVYELIYKENLHYFGIEAGFSHYVNKNSLDVLIYCDFFTKNKIYVPMKYRDNCKELTVAGQTIDRNLATFSQLMK